MKFGVSSEQGSPKNRAAGLVAGHQSFSCSELHHHSGLQGKRFVRFRIGFDYTCCKEGCEDNPEKLQKAGFLHMQTQGGTCLPSGTSPHTHTDAAQPVSVTMHSGTPPADLGARRRRIPGGASGGRSDPDQEAGSVRLAIIRGSKQTQPLMQKFVRM